MEKSIAQYYRELDDETRVKFWKAGGIINGQEVPLADSFMHTHTDLGSPKDSILTVDEYVQIAAKMGARAVTITDHGTLYGAIPLYKACDAYNAKHEPEEHIKCIFGVEFYVVDSFSSAIRKKQTRLHLIAYAKDLEGYHVLCRLVTESNKHIVKVGANDYPCISRTELEQYIGPGSVGHGHIILTSACIGGVVAGMMFASENEEKNLLKITHAIQAITTLKDNLTKQNEKLSHLTEQKQLADTLSKKSYTKRINALKKNPDAAAQVELDKEMQETEAAKKLLPQLRNQIKAINAVISDINKQITNQCKQVEADTKLEMAEKQLALLAEAKQESEDNIIPADQVEVEFKAAMQYYEALAGKGNWFIEMQFHGIAQEKKYMHVLAQLAHELDMPLVAANDAHMGTRDKCVARKIVNALRWGNDKDNILPYEPPTEDEYELYLKTDAELFNWLCKEISEKDALEAMNNRALIVDACNLELPKEKHYPKFIQEKDAS
ncbi:PHP domain-containing protein [Butyrivibrio sp.]|uniref:PHP domain-containing protein n=1 Tax=Butyrivibrio sp. TaxID=28121 RepID=UPI0025B85862|nr:PHP domain-containing protein [Butyrivibrio sp.]MBQ7430273.1 PHP domain-containing protein [Butyrivibrio sp.]MBQ9303447.1 PHP domain-containing protein [Butyrivibrio sp.]